MDPVKFVSAIDSKPIFPPYLQLADFETFLKQEASRQQVANAKEKKGEQAAEDKEHLEETNIQKQKNKPLEDIYYPDALEKELTKEFHDKVIKLQEEFAEQRARDIELKKAVAAQKKAEEK